MASSEPLVLFHPLMHSRVAPPTQGPASGGEREVPQFTPCFFAFVPPSVPRWIGWLPLAVLHHPRWPSPLSYWLGIHMAHTRRFWRGSCNEAARFALCYGPKACTPFTDKDCYAQAFTGLDHSTPMSSITTRANSQFPRPDLHRQETRHYGLRAKATGNAVKNVGEKIKETSGK
jgi:hypothetical protein